jgi:hypothetical protein
MTESTIRRSGKGKKEEEELFINEANQAEEVEEQAEEKKKKKKYKPRKEYPWAGLNPREKFVRRPTGYEGSDVSNLGRSVQANLNGFQYQKVKFGAQIAKRTVASFLLSSALDAVDKVLEAEAVKLVKLKKIESIVGE